jgi:hypothetical protein
MQADGKFVLAGKRSYTNDMLDSLVARIAGAVDTTPPAIFASAFEFETRHAMGVTFTEDVSASLSASDLVVLNGAGQQLPSSAWTFGQATQGGRTTATLVFAPRLMDGNYSVRVLAGSVADASGNANPSALNAAFFVLSADSNRDHSVDTIDFNILASNFSKTGRTFSQGNFDYDAGGNVDTIDFNLLASNFSKTLPAPTPSLGAMTAAAPKPTSVANLFGSSPIQDDYALTDFDRIGSNVI